MENRNVDPLDPLRQLDEDFNEIAGQNKPSLEERDLDKLILTEADNVLKEEEGKPKKREVLNEDSESASDQPKKKLTEDLSSEDLAYARDRYIGARVNDVTDDGGLRISTGDVFYPDELETRDTLERAVGQDITNVSAGGSIRLDSGQQVYLNSLTQQTSLSEQETPKGELLTEDEEEGLGDEYDDEVDDLEGEEEAEAEEDDDLVSFNTVKDAVEGDIQNLLNIEYVDRKEEEADEIITRNKRALDFIEEAETLDELEQALVDAGIYDSVEQAAYYILHLLTS